jgi:MSHA biogenesis protein MshP
MSTTFRERGFAIPAAVFIIVVFAVLGAAMVTMTTVSNEETALDVQQAKALRAAQAGLEWGFYQAVTGSCTSTGEVSLDAPTLSGFTVSVTCTAIPVNEAGSPTLTQVTAVACNTPGPTSPKCPGTPSSAAYVERTMTGIVSN